MKNNKVQAKAKNNRIKIIFAVIAGLLLIPLIAMQFTDEVNWSISDFVIMGFLLSGTGLLCELAIRKVTKTKHRIILCAAVVGVFLVVWGELAVGIFGTPFAGS